MQPTIRRSCCNCRQRKDKGGDEEIPKRMTVKHTLVSLDMRVFALCSLMELHRAEKAGARSEAIRPFCDC